MGHEHFYERLKPQKGVAYFILGSSAKLRKGDLRKSALTAYGNDSDYAFMLVEIDGDDMHFQTISDKGVTLDAGSVRRAGKPLTVHRARAEDDEWQQIVDVANGNFTISTGPPGKYFDEVANDRRTESWGSSR